MLYGTDGSGQLIEAAQGAKAFCPSCGGVLRPKCGSIVVHHWAHIGADCDPWSEPESKWHKEWKEYFPAHCREVTMGKNNEHRADVRLDNGLVIELQHSSIRPDTIAERERFYGLMIWIFDARRFVENFEIKMMSGLRLPLHSFLERKHVDRAARTAKAESAKYQSKIVEFTAALERVEARLMDLPAKLSSSDGESSRGAHELIDFFGGGRPGLVALTDSAKRNKEAILDVLLRLPNQHDKGDDFFGLDPYFALKYIATGVPSRYEGERQYEWQKRVLPLVSRERRVAIGQVAWFIHRNIEFRDTWAVVPSEAELSKHHDLDYEFADSWGVTHIGSQVIKTAIDNIGYFAAAAKLKADIEQAKSQTKPGGNFQEINLSLIKVPPFESGLFSAKSLNISFTWKHRRKSLFTCDHPQFWDFGDDYLLFFEDLSRQSKGSDATGHLIEKEAFLKGLIQ
jgi:hypothetical protein